MLSMFSLDGLVAVVTGAARRIVQPDELIGTVVFLTSAAPACIAGTMIPVDGGYLAV